MWRNISYAIAGLLFTLASTICRASISASECNPLNVYFGNGIMTERADARISAKVLEIWLRPLVPSAASKYIEFLSAYNPSNGLLKDLVEVFEQRVLQSVAENWSSYFPVIAGRVIAKGLETLLEDYLNTDGRLIIAALAKRLESAQIYDDQTVRDHVDLYRKALRSGHRVLVVSHSQGNLYVNAAFNHLRAQQPVGVNLNAFGVAAIGSPASVVATGDGHVTSATDLVIQRVNGLGLFGLPANDSSVPIFPAEDRLGHGFRNIYFNNRYTIRQHTQDVILNSLTRVMNHSANRPVNIDFDGMAATAPYEGIDLSNQLAASGVVFGGMKAYRNDGDPNNPITAFDIPMPPGRKGIATGAIPSSQVQLDSEFRIGRIRLMMLSGATTVTATLTSGQSIFLNLAGLSGLTPEIKNHVMDVYSCNPADRVDRVDFRTTQGYILYSMSFEAP